MSDQAVHQLSIGEVLELLQLEFPDVTISKIRFLESRGLVEPQRTASGYRQFSDADIERLRWILLQQRDHFLPLKVIKQMLDNGMEHPPGGIPAQPSLFDDGSGTELGSANCRSERPMSSDHPTGGGPGAAGRNSASTPPSNAPGPAAGRAESRPTQQGSRADQLPESSRSASQADGASVKPEAESGRSDRSLSTPADVVAALQEDPRPAKQSKATAAASPPAPDVSAILASPTGPRMTAEDLCVATGLTEELLSELEGYGLIEPIMVAGEREYSPESRAIADIAARYVELGVEPRHLRMYKVSAEREAGFIEQLTMPLVKRRNPAAQNEAIERAAELASMGTQLHASILRRRLGPSFRD